MLRDALGRPRKKTARANRKAAMNRGGARGRIIPLLIGMVLSLSACAGKEIARVVVIDPGHGGVDPGAIGTTSNTLEKEVAAYGSGLA